MAVGRAAVYTARQSVRNSGAGIVSTQGTVGSHGLLDRAAATNPLGLSGAVVDKALARVGGTGNVPPTEKRAVKSRQRHIKDTTLRLATERATTHVNTVYRTMSNDALRYFVNDNRKSQANQHRIKSSYNCEANTPMRAMPISYNRYNNPHLTGKNQIAIEEGDATYGLKNKVKGDPFLRVGPTTQPKMKLDLDAQDSGNHFIPSGVNPDLGRWAHFNSERTQKLYDNISSMNKGRNMFYMHAGKMSRRKTNLLQYVASHAVFSIAFTTVGTRTCLKGLCQ